MSLLSTNELFEQMSKENKRLLDHLRYNVKCIELLEKYRNCLLNLINKCICDQTLDSVVIINSLEVDYKTLSNESKSDSNETIDTNVVINSEVNEKQTIDESVGNEKQNLNSNQLNVSNNESKTNTILKIKSIDGTLIVNNNKDISVRRDGNISEESNDESIKVMTESIDSSLNDSSNPSIDSIDNQMNSKDMSIEKNGEKEKLQKFYETLIWDKWKVRSKPFIRENQKSLTEAVVIHCVECNQCFTSKLSLESHQKMHSGPKLKCVYPDCMYSTPFPDKLDRHQNMRHNNECNRNQSNESDNMDPKRFVCNWIGCEKRFRSNYELKVHIECKHTDQSPYKCIECNKTFCSQSSLKVHQKNHSTHRPFECSDCDKCFVTSSQLRVHQKSHYIVKRLKCQYIGCEYETNYISSFNSHQSKHKNICYFKCSQSGCDKSFSNNFTLKRHKFSVHNIGRSFVCEWPGCGLRFGYSHEVKRHLRDKHTKEWKNEKRFQCLECNRYFVSNPSLKSHQISHKTEMAFKCEYTDCSLQFKYKSSLNSHYLRHKNIRKFKCDRTECQKSFFTKCELLMHKSTVHSNERPFGCDWPGCEQKFKGIKTLKAHQLIHTNRFTFKCDFKDCSKRFNTKRNLSQHKAQHLKPYLCHWPECSERFGTKSGLTLHTNKHQDLRPNACHFDGCNQCFYSKPLLDRHIKAVHNCY